MVVVISLAGFLRRTLLFSVFEGCYLLHIKLLWTPCQSRPAKLLVVHPILSLIGRWVAAFGKQGSRILTASYSIYASFVSYPLH